MAEQNSGQNSGQNSEQNSEQDPGQDPEQDIVYESALQLWAAAQTDFDPYEVPPSEWEHAVPVRDIDIATDLEIDLDSVRDRLRDLDGHRLVIGSDAGQLSVRRPIPEDVPL